VRDANGFAVAYVYGRSTEAEAMEAKQMTMDEARRGLSMRRYRSRRPFGIRRLHATDESGECRRASDQ
jgi:hypothetical protein